MTYITLRDDIEREYDETIDEFLSQGVKLSCELPDFEITIEKPNIMFDFTEEKKKKKVTIIEKEKKNVRRKKRTAELF